MVPALNLAKAIANGRKEVLIGPDDLAGRREFDDSQRLVQRLEYGCLVVPLLRLFGHVAGQLDDSGNLTRLLHGYVGGPEPDFLPGLIDAGECTGLL